MKPRSSMKGTASVTGPWYTMVPSFMMMTSSKRANVSGGGCSSEMSVVCCKNEDRCLAGGKVAD